MFCLVNYCQGIAAQQDSDRLFFFNLKRGYCSSSGLKRERFPAAAVQGKMHLHVFSCLNEAIEWRYRRARGDLR